MYPNFIPGGPMMFNSVPYAMGGMARAGAATRGTGMLSKLGLAGKSINWGGLLNNASKTLGVVNQAIPLVKQAGPMFNNMKSMMRLASIFKDETDDTTHRNSNQVNSQNYTSQNVNNQYSQDNTSKYNELVDGYQYNKPNFFI